MHIWSAGGMHMPIWTLSLLWQTWESALSSFFPPASPHGSQVLAAREREGRGERRQYQKGPEDRAIAELPQGRLESDG